MRLDIYIKNKFNIQSRNKAHELIKANKVIVDGKIITKASFTIIGNETITIDEDQFYVSRAAYKLKYFLEDCNLSLSLGSNCFKNNVKTSISKIIQQIS